MPADHDVAALRDGCSRFLHWHGPVRAAELLATVPADTAVDRYGDGGVAAVLERKVASLLGREAAVFLPSGTMGQQAVLRAHAERRQRRTIVFHPACHLDRREGGGYQRLHRLTGRPAGDMSRLLTLTALTCLRRRLPLMPAYLRHTLAIAAELRDVPGVRVIPDPPQTPMLHSLLRTTARGFTATVRKLAADRGVWTWAESTSTADPGVQRVELAVGDATCSLPAAEIRDIVAAFVAA